MLYCIDETNIV